MIGRQLSGWLAGSLSPPTFVSLGLDPRAFLNAAQAESDPRVKPEGNDGGWGRWRKMLTLQV
ncbi:hypothetical protein GCM10007913_02910 [Devosia yakushimensis]|uniref:Uncharacterized protein n=1 Tax=Devosia yakushimensis TaxID=470028 RepID=A0ABQ5U8B3_9HYPH|nr:hypothetical protein GCM10007913_02910 [Devosia yakushimensis]